MQKRAIYLAGRGNQLQERDLLFPLSLPSREEREGQIRFSFNNPLHAKNMEIKRGVMDFFFQAMSCLREGGRNMSQFPDFIYRGLLYQERQWGSRREREKTTEETEPLSLPKTTPSSLSDPLTPGNNAAQLQRSNE